METGSQKRIYNTIMVILIAVIVLSGIMVTGHIKGWFGRNGESSGTDPGEASPAIISRSITGVASIERSGIGYTLQEDVTLQTNDIVETESGSEAVFSMGEKNTLALNEKTELQISACNSEKASLQLSSGELFAEISSAPDAFTVTFGGNTAYAAGAVFSVSRREPSSSLYVYEGKVRVAAEDGNEYTVEPGQQILITLNEDNEPFAETSDLRADYLSEYLIRHLMSCEAADLCFSMAELEQITAGREKEKQEAAKALEEEAVRIASEDSGGDESSGGAGSSSGSKSSSGGSSQDDSILTCTISIRCKSVLDNMDKLKEGKNRYVPPNGIILATSSVQFRKGESAYDVTKRACSAADIQIEAKYTPVYGSYYVEGINHLYEFDCGEMSGWLYKINGWAPDYGCSEYTLKDGDSIVWEYTCTGY